MRVSFTISGTVEQYLSLDPMEFTDMTPTQICEAITGMAESGPGVYLNQDDILMGAMRIVAAREIIGG